MYDRDGLAGPHYDFYAKNDRRDGVRTAEYEINEADQSVAGLAGTFNRLSLTFVLQYFVLYGPFGASNGVLQLLSGSMFSKRSTLTHPIDHLVTSTMRHHMTF